MWNCRLWLLGIQWILFARVSVLLEDVDGTFTARLVHRRGPYLVVKRHGFGIRTVRLLKSGKIGNGCYVKNWVPLFPDDDVITYQTAEE